MPAFKLRRFAFIAPAVALACSGALHAQGFNAVAPTPLQVQPAVDKAFEQLMASPAIKQLLEAVQADHVRSLEDLKLLTEIEAPPFKEQRRAEAYLARMKA